MRNATFLLVLMAGITPGLAQDLPESLPRQSFHLTARPWLPLNIPREGFRVTRDGFESPLGSVVGTLYVGRTSAGGEGTSIDCDRDGKPDVVFDASCRFVLQIRQGRVVAVEADREITVRIHGRQFVLKPYAPMLLATAVDIRPAPRAAELPFCIGGDISSLPEVEKNGGVYRDAGGPGDLLAILKKQGMPYARLRIWNEPRNGICGLEATLAMAKRLKQADMPWLLDFHYSDTWADPGKQTKPAAWVNLHGAELELAVYSYTRQVIAELDKQDTPPFMVQVGNEITPGMLWDDGRVGGKSDTAECWKRFAGLVKAGLRGVREGREGRQPILTMIHLDAGGNNGACRWFFDRLLAQGAEFDVIGLSYYPWWHGEMSKLRDNLNDLAPRYGRDIIVVETGYPSSEKGVDRKLGLGEKFPASPAGQKAFLRELIQIVKQVPGGRGKGVFWWEPAWIPTPRSGSGWDHRGLFDNEGKLTEAIEAFRE